MKALVFDMDGTIANFYGVEGWLEDIKAERTRPYDEAEPMFDMWLLMERLMVLKNNGWKIIITSWLAKNATKEYDDRVRTAKRNWLEKHYFPYDEIHLVKYGTTKANCTRKLGGYQVLIDDNEKVREGWHLGKAIDAKDLMEYVVSLI